MKFGNDQHLIQFFFKRISMQRFEDDVTSDQQIAITDMDLFFFF